MPGPCAVPAIRPIPSSRSCVLTKTDFSLFEGCPERATLGSFTILKTTKRKQLTWLLLALYLPLISSAFFLWIAWWSPPPIHGGHLTIRKFKTSPGVFAARG